ncbi:carbohydrate ABC transporter membrane protein 1 (CUT1 family) [Oceanotoga teriensis]|uniref:Maltose/maltodextrin transport system permease protein n=1 Tax=Oceanotoga teriensis TaxID=515440 RepID=A0AA45HIA6_9BACT|nr:ABC transporter permease subunit [Oceanotoga teriensis]PWJ91207.1 carbohydrate ABC transporter membrane protein 1 (CUT1 family) [Oceanotoga teriensis]
MSKLSRILIWLAASVLNGLMVWIIFTLFFIGNSGLAIVLAAFLFVADWAIFSSKGYPYRYTLFALFFLFILTIYPMYYTVKTSFTNYGTGHLFSREKAIDILLTDPSYNYEPKDSEFMDFSIYIKYDEEFKPTEDFLILLNNEKGKYLAEKPKVLEYDSTGSLLYSETSMYEINNDFVNTEENAYKIIRADSEDDSFIPAIEKNNNVRYTYFYSPYDDSVSSNSAYYNSVLRQNYMKALVISLNSKDFMLSNKFIYKKFGEAYKIYETRVKTIIRGDRKEYSTYIYNKLAEREVMEKDGFFLDYNENGQLQRLIGYQQNIGTKNYTKIINDSRISKPFFQIFGWTFTYAALSVILSFIIGLFFAVFLNDSGLKGRLIYRTLLIIPWAIPAFISVLVWKNGFFNQTYGILNRFVLSSFGAESLAWLDNPFWAKVSVIIVNTWLGFPYMMTVTLGSLQSIPSELYEAASIDGASRWKQFKKITLPLLMVSVAPLLVMSFAFNFNNFTNIYLLTNGGPAIPGTSTPAGATDILISFTYKLAFEGSRGQDFGFAAAISVLIFAIIAILSYFNFKFSGSFEEVSR